MQLRQRKIQTNYPQKESKMVGDRKHGRFVWRLLKYAFLGCVASLTVLLLLVAVHNATPVKLSSHAPNFVDTWSLALGLQEKIHSVIIDAGSTGSRVLAFTFHRVISDGTLKLQDELWAEVKPGLSSYSEDPKKGADSISGLLEKAKGRIPAEFHKTTPLVLKATAGLRLLPEDKSKGILKEVTGLFSGSPFMVSDKSVDIMDGNDEGVFSWFTLNFLLDRLGGSPDDTVVALDLGGGSTQITFTPSDMKTLEDAPAEFTMPLSLMHRQLTMYTHSYLKLGLMAARQTIVTTGAKEGATDVKSACINPIVNTNWTYSGITYTVSGSGNAFETTKEEPGSVSQKVPVVDFAQCQLVVKKLITGSIHRPAELNYRTVYAMSYFFDRATEAGLVDPFETGSVTVDKLISTAELACRTPNVEQPFACLDLTFISTLLHDGYGLKGDTTIHLVKKIDGHETSWALGAAYHALTNGV